MRKWICVGVLGGLLEFGIIYQVAFSEPDSPSPEALSGAQPGSRPKAAKSRPPRPASPARDDGRPVPEGESRDSAVGRSGAAAPPIPLPDSLLAASSGAILAVAAFPAPPPSEVPAAEDGAGEQEPEPVDGNIQLAQVLPLHKAPVEPPPAPPADLSALPVEELIRTVFGPEGDKAVEVARCESTLRTHAQKGQFLGLFQMGANERADYGHGPDAVAQVLAAHALFLDRGWQPWECA